MLVNALTRMFGGKKVLGEKRILHEDTTEHGGHERIYVSGSESDSEDPNYIIKSFTDNDDYCNDGDLYMDKARCDVLNEQIGEDGVSAENNEKAREEKMVNQI